MITRLLPRWFDFVQLARLNRPIGILLLLWPTLWALWLAADGVPSVHNLVVFTLGVVLTRSAGCVLNDYADRDFDGDVERTKERPLVKKTVTPKEALIFSAVLFALAFALVLTTNLRTILFSFVALSLAAFYPFAKRYTYLPQVVLGAAFGCSIPMAFLAEGEPLTAITGLLFVGNLLWTVAYDTQYAMVDRDDDVKIGIKSTAILFGDLDNFIIVALQAGALVAFILLGVQLSFGFSFYAALFCAALVFFVSISNDPWASS